MKPDTYTVQQLFERDVRYIVPLYQRPYVWDEEHQWAPLWDDISALLDHQDSGGEAPLWSHFLGAIVLEQETTSPGEIPRYVVIDGQQRLTTLQLLIAAAAKALTTAGAENDAVLLRELAINNPRKAPTIEEQLKVWPTNANRAAFLAAMAPDGPPAGWVDDPDNLIDEAFAYFVARADEYITGADEDESATITGSAGIASIDHPLIDARAERLRITLCDLLKVVSIGLAADDNAQIIFETLNARGTPLLALDLVKNAAFHQAARQGSNTDSLHDTIWRPQLGDDAYWRQPRRQGRINRPAAELFLMHWLTMQTEDLVPATELFATFRQQILRPSTDAEALLRELNADATTMRSFDDLSPAVDFFARLPALDASTVLPIVLLLYRSPDVSAQRRAQALRILESWLARRALMRLTAKYYNRLVPRLIARIKADLPRADEALLRGLSGGEGEISRWPGDDEFYDFLLTRDVYGSVSGPRLIMALAAVETSLYTTKTDVPTLAPDLSLEHLMPQHWEEHWPIADADDGSLPDVELEQTRERRNSRLHRLGNLTIVTQPLNASMSNAPWPTKRSELNKHSKLLINARLADYDEWDELYIEERGRWLAQRLVEIWPSDDRDNWI
jgi:hypothetical protein